MKKNLRSKSRIKKIVFRVLIIPGICLTESIIRYFLGDLNSSFKPTIEPTYIEYIEKTEPVILQNIKYSTISNSKINRAEEIFCNHVLLQVRGGGSGQDIAWLMLWYYMFKNFNEVSGFQVAPPNHQLFPTSHTSHNTGSVNSPYGAGKGIGQRSVTVRESLSSFNEGEYQLTYKEAFQKLNDYYGGYVWEIPLFGEVYKNHAQQLASHLKHGKGLGYIPQSLSQAQLEELNILGIVKYTRLGFPLPSLEDCKGMHDKIVELFTDKPMVPITELDMTNLEKSIEEHQSNIIYDLDGGRRERGEIKPDKSFYKVKAKIQLLYNPETNDLISAQKRSRPKAFFGNIEKFSSLNPVVKDKVSTYYKNQTSQNQNLVIDSNYSINARFLSISKFNETANDSNTPSGNKTILILPPEPKNN